MSCSGCFSGSLWPAEPIGGIATLHGVQTYITGSTSLQEPEAIIIFITDAFGFNLVNSKLLADAYGIATGFRVLVPDIIPGGGVPAYSLSLMNAVNASIPWWNVWGHLKRIGNIVRMMGIFIPFAIRTRTAFPGILAYVRAVRSELPAGSKLGVAGFCWGAMQTAQLCAEPATHGGGERLVDAHFAAHPSGLKKSEIIQYARRFTVPFSLAVGDKDVLLPEQAAAELEAGLRGVYSKEPSHFESKMYAGCGHGFAVRADREKTEEDQAARDATDQAANWFRKFLA